LLDTVVSNSRQATVILAGKQGRSPVIPRCSAEAEQLAPLLSIDNASAQLLSTSTALSGMLRFLFRISLHAFDSIPGIPDRSPARRPGGQHQYLLNCPRLMFTLPGYPGG